MKKTLFILTWAIGSLLLLNQPSFAVRHTPGSQEKGRVPAHYKNLDEVKQIPKTLAPERFTDAETRAAYQVAKDNPQLLLQLPCYCYCDDGINHKSLLSCYEDEHAAHCDICRKEAIDADHMQKATKLSAAEIREKLIQTKGHLPPVEIAHGNHQQSAATPPTPDKPSPAVTVAPAFALKNTKGKTVRLADFKGKVVLLNFWATWCAPCQKEMPELVKLQKKYAAKGLQILGVTYEPEKPAVLNRIAQKFRINYPFLLGSEELAQQYHVEEALPTTIIVDRDGNIQTVILGMIDSKDVEEKLARFLQ